MTVTTDKDLETFPGNGAATTFAFTVKCQLATHIKCKHFSTANVETKLVKDTDFSVTLNADGTSTITFPLGGSSFSTLATGETLEVRRIVPLTQTLALSNHGTYDPSSVESALDRIMQAIQQLSPDNPDADGNIVYFDSDGYPQKGITYVELLDLAAASNYYDVPVAYSASSVYTTAQTTVIESGVIYAPKFNALPIGPEAFDSSHWYVVQGYISGSGNALSTGAIDATTNLLHTGKGKSYLSSLLIADLTDGQYYEIDFRTSIGDGGGGVFRWDSSDLSSKVTIDTQGGIYVPPDSDATGASGAWVRKFNNIVETAWFGALGTYIVDETTAIQCALDTAASFFLGGGIGGNGFAVYLNPGKYKYSGLTIPQGVSFIGAGRYNSVLMLTGASSTGLKCAAATSQLAADIVSHGRLQGIGFWSDEAAPTSQLIWNITGFTRWHVEDCIFEWFDGCTGIECSGATLAGSGGPAQWYNTIMSCFLIHAASRPSGGYAIVLGDDASTEEQVTALTMIGGRISASGSGTGLTLRTTGCAFYGLTLEGCNRAVEVGSSSTRGASSNSFFGCYWESNTTNRYIHSNAAFTQFEGSFLTGGTDTDNSTTTLFNEPGDYSGYSGSSGSQKWEVRIANGASRRPQFKGSTFPSIGLPNSAGTELIVGNGAATSSATQYFRVIEDGLVNNLFECGTSHAKFQAKNIRINNDDALGIFTGTGSPESAVTAEPGSLYLNLSGGASTTLYVKESGSGNTGWIAK